MVKKVEKSFKIVGAERAKRAERLIPKFSGHKTFELVPNSATTRAREARALSNGINTLLR